MIRCFLWFCWVSGISFAKKKKNFSRLVYKQKQSVTSRKMSWRRVYVKHGTYPEPTGTCRNLPEPAGINRNLPEPTRNLEKSANDKIKKKTNNKK